MRVVDAEGRRHKIIDKLPMFTVEELDASSHYPQPGVVRCRVLNRLRDSQGRDLIRICTDPDWIESTEGLSNFIVAEDQLSDLSTSIA